MLSHARRKSSTVHWICGCTVKFRLYTKIYITTCMVQKIKTNHYLKTNIWWNSLIIEYSGSSTPLSLWMDGWIHTVVCAHQDMCMQCLHEIARAAVIGYMSAKQVTNWSVSRLRWEGVRWPLRSTVYPSELIFLRCGAFVFVTAHHTLISCNRKIQAVSVKTESWTLRPSQ